MLVRVCLLLLWLSCGLAAQEKTVRVVQWSDIHGGGPKFSLKIWDMAVHDSLAQKPDAIVITGDNGDNHGPEASFHARLRSFLAVMTASLRGARCPIMICLGNNDVRMNYQTDPALLAETAATYRKSFGSLYYLDGLGNGVHPQKVGGYTWISINSQIFSRKNHYRGVADQARHTLDWLKARLRDAKGGPVVILMHIPPAHDLYDNQAAWRDADLRAFLEVLGGHRGSLRILTGHFHRNEIHAVELPQGSVPLLVAGSLSLKHGYEPNWRVHTWKGDRIEYTLFYPGHLEWTRSYTVHPVAGWPLRLQDPIKYSIYLRDMVAYHDKALEPLTPAQVFHNVQSQFWIRPDKLSPKP